MLDTSQFIHNQIVAFFKSYPADTRIILYKALNEELGTLLLQARMMGRQNITQLVSYKHKLKGMCRYLGIENEVCCAAEADNTELLFNITLLQDVLKEVDI